MTIRRIMIVTTAAACMLAIWRIAVAIPGMNMPVSVQVFLAVCFSYKVGQLLFVK